MTLSHAPPFPTSTSPSHSPARDDRHQRTSARHRKSSHPVNLAPTRSTATETDRIGLSAIFDMPPDESRRTAQPPRTRSTATHSMRPPPSTGSTTRPSLGNLFLGPLSTPAEEERDDDEVSYVSRVRSVRMSIATKPEMAELGYETVIASGIDTVRRRSERVTLGRERAAPLSVGSEVSDPASSVSGESLSFGSRSHAHAVSHSIPAVVSLAFQITSRRSASSTEPTRRSTSSSLDSNSPRPRPHQLPRRRRRFDPTTTPPSSRSRRLRRPCSLARPRPAECERLSRFAEPHRPRGSSQSRASPPLQRLPLHRTCRTRCRSRSGPSSTRTHLRGRRRGPRLDTSMASTRTAPRTNPSPVFRRICA